MTRALSTALVLMLTLVGAGGAAAQDASPPASTQGPLVLEPVRNPIVFAPEYKVTKINGDVEQLAGGYAGVQMDERLLIGGAVYTLVNGGRGTELTYGGFLIGWSTQPMARVRFGGRALVGGGTATLPLGDASPARFGGGRDRASVPVFGRDEFLVFEPQGNVVARFNSHAGVEGSVGYRMTGADAFGSERLNGVTGTIALQFGW